MTLEQLKNYIKAHTDVGEGIRLGSIDGNAERFLGVYPAKETGAMRICLGGPEQTRTGELRATVLIHWTRSQVQAEAKARELYGLFYGLSAADMDGADVRLADPGGGPIAVGVDARGIFEYVINLRLIYMKERENYGSKNGRISRI